jgi:zinc protease
MDQTTVTTMARRIIVAAALLLFAAPTAAPTVAQDIAIPVDIPYERFVLDNGLTVIVHEDRKAPIVAVNVWYHVGSKNEKLRRTGFAHLFEHLMYNGSENFDQDYFQVLEKVGATDLNGTTNQDRTNYFQNVPTSAMDLALWMESDRMGHLEGAISQEKLDEQRGVVQNEKRQGENEPYGLVYDLITENTYPEGHPYSWTVIGSMEDLDAASVEDVKEWFSTWYGAANAVLVLAGDLDAATAREKAEHYFGHIPAGPPIAKHDTWIAKRTGEHRMVHQDRVPQARVYKVWNVPEWGSETAHLLELAGDVLSSGKTSRLYRRLVYDEQIATDVSAGIQAGEIGSQFVIRASATPGVDLAAVEAAIDEEMARFLAEGPAEREMERVRTQALSAFLRGVERIGGFGGKSDVLAEGEVYAGNPEAWKDRYRAIHGATAETVAQAARAWLSDGVFVLEVHPFPGFQESEAVADRSRLPDVGTPPVPSFPDLQRATLSNGLDIVLVERHTTPVVNFRLMVDAGFVSDAGRAPGTASLAMNMLDEGTGTRDALEISEELALLGASLGAGSSLDVSVVSLSALRQNLDASLDLYTDVILNPSFPEGDFERLKQQQIVSIQREKVSPISMALRVFPRLLYGDDHPYGIPFTGSGTEESVAALTTDDLEAFHRTWFRPGSATLVVTGDITMEELLPRLEQAFGSWPSGEAPGKTIAGVDLREGGVVYLVDRPGSQQSIIFAGHVAPPKGNERELAIQLANTVLGGAFISRVNMNLREDKGWAYGAFTILWDARGQRPYFAYAPVQSDRTADSMLEIRSEVSAFVGDRPATAEELAWAIDTQTLTLPGQWETLGAIGSSVAEIVQYGLPDDHFQGYAARVRAVTLEEVRAAAREFVHPDRLVWVVVGDRQAIEPAIREAGFTDIRLLDADGNPVEGGSR